MEYLGIYDIMLNPLLEVVWKDDRIMTATCTARKRIGVWMLLAGFYWAIGLDGELVVSTRGNILDYDFLEDSSILDQLTHELIRRGHVW